MTFLKPVHHTGSYLCPAYKNMKVVKKHRTLSQEFLKQLLYEIENDQDKETKSESSEDHQPKQKKRQVSQGISFNRK